MLEKLSVPAEGLEAQGRLMYNDYGKIPANKIQKYVHNQVKRLA